MSDNTATPPKDEPAFLTARQVSEMTGFTVGTLNSWRSESYCTTRNTNSGPPWHRRTNGRVVYMQDEVEAWMAETKRKPRGGRSNG